ncbi:MAG TPA: c-type cytochrome, partial [Candidatus Nitrosotenuis sp.]|nr:c-type cytochrome [Candidatus Nitrosotenuis sp.]
GHKGELTMRRRIVFFVLLVALLAAAGVGVWFTARHGFSARENPSALEAFVARSIRSMGVPAEARNAKNPFPATPEILAEARDHFADHCATCHANDGSGQTTLGQNLNPRAPDMRLPPTQNLTDGELYYIIHNGIRMTGMPAWGPPEKDDDSWKLVHFIRYLPKLTPEELREMEKLNPRSLAEWEAKQAEEEFLRGGEPKIAPRKHH